MCVCVCVYVYYVCISSMYVFDISQCIYYSYYLIPLLSIGQDIENIMDNSHITICVYKLNPSPIDYLIRCYRKQVLYV